MRIVAEVRTVAVVDHREDAAADGHAGRTRVSGGFPRLTIGFDLLALLDVQGLTRLVILERRALEIHPELRRPLGCRVGARAPPDPLVHEVVDPEVRAIQPQLFGGDGELDGLK